MLSLISIQNSRCSNLLLHTPPPIRLPWWSDQVKKRATFVDIRCVKGFTLSKVSQSITGTYLVSMTHPLNSNTMGCLGPSAPEWFPTPVGPVLITALFLFWHKWEQNTLPDKGMVSDVILASWQSRWKKERSLCLCPRWLSSSNSFCFLFDISLLLLLVGCQPVLFSVDLDQGWPDPVRTFLNPAGFSVYQGETSGFQVKALYPPGRSDNPAGYSSYGPGLDTPDLEGEQM